MQTDTTPDALLTYDDVARHFKVTSRAIRKWVRAGSFPRPCPIGAGHRVRFRASDVAAFLANLPTK